MTGDLDAEFGGEDDDDVLGAPGTYKGGYMP
jgi:hypothetical protein